MNLDWLAGFEPWMEQRGCPRRTGTDHEWNISKRHHNVTYDQAMDCVHQFNHSDHMRSLKPYKDSVEYMTKLAKEGFKFIAVTSMSDDSTAKLNRAYNLRELYGDIFLELHCLKVGESKQQILSDNWGGSGYMWLEDHFKNAEAGHEVGLNPILVSTTHNEHYTTDLFPRVDAEQPWKEIYKLAQSHYQPINMTRTRSVSLAS